VEVEGIARAVAARETAAVILVVLDRSTPLTDDDRDLLEATAASTRVVVANKADLAPAWAVESIGTPALPISALAGTGLSELRTALLAATVQDEPSRDTPAVTNLRHVDLLERARGALGHARDAASQGTPEEFVLSDLHEARNRLEEVTGARTPDDVLNAIFEKFCIGK
jgi:tRNA modification GTPase